MAYCGERNKQVIYFANNIGDTPITDEDGYYTLENAQGYENPRKLRINVSEAKSRMDRLASVTYIDPYGIELGYNKVLATSDMNIGINDGAIFWVDRMPELKEDGSTDTPFDYECVQIKKSLNNILIAIKKVSVG